MASTAQALTDEPILLTGITPPVATLTLNRPRQYNALSEDMLIALQDALDRVAEDETVRVVVIAANGKAFCGGHDLKEMRSSEDRAFHRALFDRCGKVMQTIHNLPQPVIARVQGIATAAGCQLVAQCDLAVAAGYRPLCRVRHQRGPVLLHAGGAVKPQHAPQAGHADAAHRRFHRCGDR